MNARIKYLLLLPVALIVAACGGGGGGVGGGGETARLVGRVLNVETGAALNPAASVQVGNSSVLTSTQDGSFSLQAPPNSTNVVVDTRSAFGTWTFVVPPLSGTTDAGDLWVGPQRVTLRGRVLDAATNQPIANAAVSFAGRSGRTLADGRFALPEVAYSNATQTAFWGIKGSVSASGYFRTDFSAQPNVAAGGSVTVNDILLTPTSDIEPPPAPFNIWGRVAPEATAPGTIVTLKQNGNPVRIYNVGSDRSYFFWVEPGNYTIEFVRGSLSAQAQANLTRQNEVIRRDVTLQ